MWSRSWGEERQGLYHERSVHSKMVELSLCGSRMIRQGMIPFCLFVLEWLLSHSHV